MAMAKSIKAREKFSFKRSLLCLVLKGKQSTKTLETFQREF